MSTKPLSNRPDRIAAALCASLLVAVPAVHAQRLAPPSFDRPWTPRVSESGEIVTSAKRGAVATPDGYTLPANPALATLPVSPQVDPDHAYTLAELVDLAQSINPGTRIAWNEAKGAALAADVVDSAYRPRIAATAVGGYHANGSDVSALGTSVRPDTRGTAFVSAVSLNWLLFDFGERASLVEAARQQAIVADIAFTAEHQRITHAVAIAFYDDTATRARQLNADRAAAVAIDVRAAAEARFAKGIGTVVEVAQTRQGAAQADLVSVQARSATSDARLRLLTAVGLSPFATLKVADAGDGELAPASVELAERAVAEALSRRPDMLAALAEQKASVAGVRAARAEFLPKVFTSGTVAYARGNGELTTLPGVAGEPATLNVSDRRSSATVLIGIHVPLYDGGVRADRLAQARARSDGAVATLRQTRDRAILEIVTAENAVRSGVEAHAASRVVLDAARTSFDAAFAAYRHGVGSVTDVNLAQQQQLAAANASSDAYAAARHAAATLALATGALGGTPR